MNIAEHYEIPLPLELKEESTGPHRVYMITMRKRNVETGELTYAPVTEWMRGREARVWLEGFHTAVVMLGNSK